MTKVGTMAIEDGRGRIAAIALACLVVLSGAMAFMALAPDAAQAKNETNKSGTMILDFGDIGRTTITARWSATEKADARKAQTVRLASSNSSFQLANTSVSTSNKRDGGDGNKSSDGVAGNTTTYYRYMTFQVRVTVPAHRYIDMNGLRGDHSTFNPEMAASHTHAIVPSSAQTPSSSSHAETITMCMNISSVNLLENNGAGVFNGKTFHLYTGYQHFVKFDGNGAKGGSMPNQAFRTRPGRFATGTQALSANSYSRYGYIFAGWNANADGTGTSYSDGQSVKGLATTPGGVATLYAQWTPRVTADGSASFENSGHPLGGLSVKKTDTSGNALAGAVFRVTPADAAGAIYDGSGAQVDHLDITTESGGSAKTRPDALAIGASYQVVEIEAPEGYEVDGSVRTVELDASEPDGAVVEAGTWMDEPKSVAVTLSAGKSFSMPTGSASTAALEIGEGQFSFELLEGAELDSARVIETAAAPASSGGAATASFDPISYTYPDCEAGTEHVYWIREKAGTDAAVSYDSAVIKAVVVADLDASGDLAATVRYYADDGSGAFAEEVEAPVFANVRKAAFGLAVSKEDDAGAPLAGATFTAFEISGMGDALPAALGTRTGFESLFPISADKHSQVLSWDAAALEAAGLAEGPSQVTGADGRAAFEGLEAGRGYLVVETASPPGYTLADRRNGADGAHAVVYFVKGTEDGSTFAHVCYPDAAADKALAGRLVNLSPGDETRDGRLATGYRVDYVGEDAAATTVTEPMVLANEPNVEKLGGLSVRKLSTSGEPLEGAVFEVYKESDYQAALAAYRAWAGDGADDARFVGGLFDEDPPFELEPAATVESGGDGVAATGARELEPGSYRVVEVTPPVGYAAPDYGLDDPSGGRTGSVVATVVEDAVTAAGCAFVDPELPPDEEPLTARKQLSGGYAPLEGEFTFGVYAADDADLDAPLLLATNAADGAVDFGSVRWQASRNELGLYSAEGALVHAFGGYDGSEVELVMRELVPGGATCGALPGETYAQHAAENGYEEAAGYEWALGGIVYDAQPVRLVISTEDAEVSVAADAGAGPVFTNVADDDGTGEVRVMKVSAETGEPLAGATFTAEATIGTRLYRASATTDGSGEAVIAGLPIGAYTVTETGAPEGYAINGDWSRTAEVASAGDVVDLTLEQGDWCVDGPAPVPLPITGGPGNAAIYLAAALAGLTALASAWHAARKEEAAA